MRASLVALTLLAAAPARAADPAIAFAAAWAPAADKGADTTLYLEATNPAAEDAIVRVRCAAANFSELRTIDRGEGFPSARAVKAIPLAAGRTTALTADSFNVHLMQLTHPLAPGDVFDSTVRLRGGSQQTVTVSVRPAEAGPE